MARAGARELDTLFGLNSRVSAAFDCVFAGKYASDGFGVGDVFFDQDALGERVGIVGLEDGNAALEDDNAVIQVLVDEVDGAAGEFAAVVEGLQLGFEAGEGWQQRGVDVEDPVGEGGDELGRKQAHVARKDDQVYPVLAQAGCDVGIVLSTFATFGDKERYGQAENPGGIQTRGFGNVGYDNGDFSAGQAAFAN